MRDIDAAYVPSESVRFLEKLDNELETNPEGVITGKYLYIVAEAQLVERRSLMIAAFICVRFSDPQDIEI